MKKGKLIAWLLGGLAVAVIAFYFVTRSDTPDLKWRTLKVQRGKVTVTVTATGPINPLQTVQVGTQVTGTIARLLADFNSEVKKGQIIALIDTTLLSASQKDAVAVQRKARVQLSQMKKEFDRTEKLYKSGVIAQADYDLALSNYQGAITSVSSFNAQLDRARINLAYATIHAPIDGVVISRNVDVGQTVVSSFNTPTLFTIANDLTKMEVYANVDEADIGQVKVGQTADFTVDAYPDDVFVGQVKQIRLQPSVVQNVVNYTVIIDVQNPDLKLLPGLTANINIKVKEHDNILKVPANALHFTPPPKYFEYAESFPDSIKKKILISTVNDRKYVWIKRDNYLLPIAVVPHLTDGSFTEVEGDLHPGEEIVIATETVGQASATSRSPFMPSFNRPTRGMR